jgi:hypothetical protein
MAEDSEWLRFTKFSYLRAYTAFKIYTCAALQL